MDPDYRLFASVVAEGSLSAAGRSLRISPAMVSKRLARLEARLGVRLVHRTTRRLALTEAGAGFHRDVVAILRDIAAAEARVADARSEPRGPLRITAPTSFGRMHVAPHLADFFRKYPQIELELNLSDAFVDLLTQPVDLAIRIASDIPSTLVAHRLAGSRRVLCASPTYLAQHGEPASIAALRRHRLLAAEGQLPWRLTDGQQRVLVEGVSHVRTNSSEIVRELATTGVGIALRSMWDIGGELASGALCHILTGWEGPKELGIYAVHTRAPAVPPAIGAFIAHLRERLSNTPWDAAPRR